MWVSVKIVRNCYDIWKPFSISLGSNGTTQVIKKDHQTSQQSWNHSPTQFTNCTVICRSQQSQTAINKAAIKTTKTTIRNNKIQQLTTYLTVYRYINKDNSSIPLFEIHKSIEKKNQIRVKTKTEGNSSNIRGEHTTESQH